MEDTIRVYLKEIGQESVDWIHMAQQRDQWWITVHIAMNLQVP